LFFICRLLVCLFNINARTGIVRDLRPKSRAVVEQTPLHS
jgi:Putative addiction module component